MTHSLPSKCLLIIAASIGLYAAGDPAQADYWSDRMKAAGSGLAQIDQGRLRAMNGLGQGLAQVDPGRLSGLVMNGLGQRVTGPQGSNQSGGGGQPGNGDGTNYNILAQQALQRQRDQEQWQAQQNQLNWQRQQQAAQQQQQWQAQQDQLSWQRQQQLMQWQQQQLRQQQQGQMIEGIVGGVGQLLGGAGRRYDDQ